ncbi:MAG TPA: NUDIX domain-containing protein [Mycobacteriales bacterium]|nr:NUDIX domain-containing protein [Mycobacteriales bacterium]
MTSLPADAADEVVERRAARVLLVDGSGRVLLFHGCDPADASAGSWWFTPGGGLDPGETPAQGAARELAEETGLVVAPEQLGVAVHERVAEFRFAGGAYRQSEDFFALRVDAHDVDTSGFSELETSCVLGHRWWTAGELRGTAERVYPPELADLVERALA